MFPPSELYFSIARPVQSTADTKPQLHPALLRLSAMISHCFNASMMVVGPNYPR
jgi:hypothetical protein